MKKNVAIIALGCLIFTTYSVFTYRLHGVYTANSKGSGASTQPIHNGEIANAEASTGEGESDSFFDNLLGKLSSEKEPEKAPVIPRETKPIRGIYVSAAAMNSPKVRERILEIINTTRINALVVDIKDSSGYVFLPTEGARNTVDPRFAFSRTPYSQGAAEFMHMMKERDIYMIARITAFQDPVMTKYMPDYALKNKDGSVWKDRKGMAFLDPQNKTVWEYLRALSSDTYAFGFDEIQFDYIRYPSDGLISQIAYHIPEGKTKSDMIEKFFEYINTELKVKEGIYISADVFGDVVRLKGDPGIGQTFEKTLAHFDAVSPMVYPSHFSPGSYGILKPDSYPKAMMEGIARDTNNRFTAWCEATYKKDLVVDPNAKNTPTVEEVEAAWQKVKKEKCPTWINRPWIQDFSLHMDYGYNEVKGQIDALEAAGITSWLVWNPSSRYTVNAFK